MLCPRRDIMLGVAMFKVTDVFTTCSSARSPSTPCTAGASAGLPARRAFATLPGSSYNAIGLRIDRHKRNVGPENGQTRSQHCTEHYHCIRTLRVTRVLFFFREVLQRSPVACSNNSRLQRREVRTLHASATTSRNDHGDLYFFFILFKNDRQIEYIFYSLRFF